MAFRFRRSFKIAPGVRLNLNSKSMSVRIGPKGFGYTVSSYGRKRGRASTSVAERSYARSSHYDASPEVGKKSKFWPTVLTIGVLVLGIGVFSNRTPSGTAPEPANQSLLAPVAPAFPKPATLSPVLATTQPTRTLPIATEAPSVQQPLVRKIVEETKYVTATSLNVRSSPSTAAEVVGKLSNGAEISVVDRFDGWLQVRTTTGSQGWVSEQYTSTSRVEPPPVQAFLAPAAPAQDRNAIIQEIISQSIRSYSGNCPCPYNTMRNGRSCGGNSAYSKPGGRSPICYPSDVSEAMIARFTQ